MDTIFIEEKEFNLRIARKLKFLRKRMGLTGEQVGKILDVSFQQVQKYEKGGTKISIYKLYIFLEYCRKNINGFDYTIDDLILGKEIKVSI